MFSRKSSITQSNFSIEKSATDLVHVVILVADKQVACSEWHLLFQARRRRGGGGVGVTWRRIQHVLEILFTFAAAHARLQHRIVHRFWVKKEKCWSKVQNQTLMELLNKIRNVFGLFKAERKTKHCYVLFRSVPPPPCTIYHTTNTCTHMCIYQ